MSERDIFTAARMMTDPAARFTYLDGACGADAALRARVEALLRAHDQPDSLLDHPAAVASGPSPDATEALTGNHDPVVSATRTAAGENGSADDEPLTFLSPSTRPDSLGRIGHYEVLQVLGKGGFGIVFRAFDETLQRVVALKVMAPQLAAASPARKRFLREARSSAQVRHENVVQVYEVAEQPLPYLAMEFIPGETLQQRLDRVGPVEPAEVVRVGRQIAEGLAAAHATDLIHRDIKPGNVLLESGQQKVRITDFGLARTADDASISQSGIIAGTPMYMAPEQAKGETLDQRADLFSLGSVLYQMAAGRPPFRANGTVAVLKRVAEDTPRPIREVIPETPQWLCDIIARLHAKSPDDRFQSAREVADVLADCEAQLKAHARLKDYSRIPRGKPRRSGRRKWVAVAAVALLPVIALVLTEFAGVTHLFRGQQIVGDPIRPGGDPTPVPVVKQEPLPSTFTNGIGMEFVLVPKGRSWLGWDKEVEIPADFYLGKYEVTQEEWGKVMGENPSFFSHTGAGKDAVKDISDADLKRFPVEDVSWDQCQVFVAKLNQVEKETGWVYRLPTETEWEYACRGGPMADKADSAFDFYFARPTNTLLPDVANFDKGLNRTCKVGSYPPNRLGLYDMHGNVWEFSDKPQQRPDGTRWVGRGGSWRANRADCQVQTLGFSPSGYHDESWGLRLARVPVVAPSREPKSAPPAVAPFTDADVRRIAALPADQQVEEVRKELMRRNPGFDGKMDTKIEGGAVTEFKIVTDQVTDIAPIGVFNSLRALECSGTSTNFTPNGQLADLAPLKGLKLADLMRLDLHETKATDAGMAYFNDCKDLKDLNLTGTKVSDAGLAHFKDCKDLTILALGRTRVSDAGLADFKDWKDLTYLCVDYTKVTDRGLAHFKGAPLTVLWIYHTDITDLSPLQGMPLEEIRLTPKNITKGLDILRDMKSLKTIGVDYNQSWPAAEFWERYDKGEFGAAPFTDADVKRIAALPAEQQVEEVRKELMRRNPGFDGKMETKIEDGVVTEFRIVTDQVTDIAPIRVFNGLRVLGCSGTWGNGLLADLTPLEGMNLAGLRYLDLSNTKVTDAGMAYFKDSKSLSYLNLAGTRVSDTGLSNFQDCKALTVLALYGTNVTDAGMVHFQDCKDLTDLYLAGTKLTDAGLAPFKNCKNLTHLSLDHTQVGDAGLVQFNGMPLKELTIENTDVTDLTPLQRMPLEEIRLTPKNITRGLDILRAMKCLVTIGIAWEQTWPAAEFWARYDKGEFK